MRRPQKCIEHRGGQLRLGAGDGRRGARVYRPTSPAMLGSFGGDQPSETRMDLDRDAAAMRIWLVLMNVAARPPNAAVMAAVFAENGAIDVFSTDDG